MILGERGGKKVHAENGSPDSVNGGFDFVAQNDRLLMMRWLTPPAPAQALPTLVLLLATSACAFQVPASIVVFHRR